MTKREALETYIKDVLNEEIVEINDNRGYFEVETSSEQMSFDVYTDEEANERTRDNIEESICYFNTDFLLDYIDVEATPVIVQAFKEMQDVGEGVNPLILALIGDDFDDLVEDAIKADGRGHFISSYDGEEIESDEYFIYRAD